MKPSTVFKILLGTYAVLLFATIFAEISNVQLTAPMVNQLTSKSIQQACEIFGQETYKETSYGVIVGNQPNLVSADSDAVYISGVFYEGATATQVYDRLYTRSTSEFRDWLRGTDINGNRFTGKWKSLDALAHRIDSSVATGGDLSLGEVYEDNLMTPLNLGITYLDKGTVERIARWNLSSLLLNGVQNTYGKYVNLHRDATGVYVNYKGFRVYTSQLRISSIKYEILDLSRAADKDKYEQYTSMRANTIIDNITDGGTASLSSDERRFVCFASVEYTVPVHYDGVTPIKNVAEFFWNYEVSGLDSNTNKNNDKGTHWNDATENMTGGGFSGNGNLPVPGRIIYFVTR